MAKTRIRNVARLHRKLIAMPRLARAEITDALAESAEEISGKQRGFAPVDTGRLRDSIRWYFRFKSVLRITARIVAATGRGAGSAFYGTFQEFGTVQHNAQPFFFPIYRAFRRAARARIRNATRRAGRIAARLS
jgi:HK97 gp10 family phage protein